MKHLINIILLLILISGCYKEPDFIDFDYRTYNRVVGPRGGSLMFFANYENDTDNSLNVEMEFPQDALDSMMVFNMYQFEDYELVLQMQDGFAQVGSRFLYFVPFYESEGYYKREHLDLSYHLSTDFNKPVRVKYYFLADKDEVSPNSWQEAELYHDYYKNTDEKYRLFKIKIPKTDEWGENNNIYVNWNKQGYPDGYDRTDLVYIINGSWSSINDWGSGIITLENWEPFNRDDYTLVEAGIQSYVEFEIDNSDYMYVLARILYVAPDQVPHKIKNALTTKYPLLELERAAFNGAEFTLYLSDNSIVKFKRNGDFIERVIDNLKDEQLPENIHTYINTNYSTDKIKKTTQSQKSETSSIYRILLNSGIILYFDQDGTFLGRYEYGLAYEQLPANAKNYIEQEHAQEIVLNVTLDNGVGGTSSYIVYLHSDKKVYFNLDGNWNNTTQRLKKELLPDKIEQYFEENNPNPQYISITYKYDADDSEYEIELIDESYYIFDKDGELVEMEIEDIKKEMLPTQIQLALSTVLSGMEVTSIDYYYYDYGQTVGYEIDFDDLLYLDIDNSGTIKEFYGSHYNHLLPKMKAFVDTYYPGKEDVMYCGYLKGEGYEIEFIDGMYILLDADGNLVELYGEDISHLPARMRNYVTTNFPGINVISSSYSPTGDTEFLAENDEVFYIWEAHLEGGLWLGFDNNQDIMFIYDDIIQPDEFILPIAQYLQTNHPGIGVAYAYNYYSDFYGFMIYYITLDDFTELVFDDNGVFQAQFKKSSSTKLKMKSSTKNINRDKLGIKDKWSLTLK